MQSLDASIADKSASEGQELIHLKNDVSNLTRPKDPINLLEQFTLNAYLILRPLELIRTPCSKVSVENAHELNPSIDQLCR
mgnify:CR=1 FL=1